MIKKIIVGTLVEMSEFAEKFLGSLVETNEATIVLLSGNLGAGKTSFVQAVARILGVKDRITSPTFVIQKVYNLTGQGFKRLVHVDAYRLGSAEELLALGFGKIVKDRDNLIMIEWPENVAEALPNSCRSLRFKFVDEKVREITINGD